jgi:hypothetical protein
VHVLVLLFVILPGCVDKIKLPGVADYVYHVVLSLSTAHRCKVSGEHRPLNFDSVGRKQAIVAAIMISML